MASVAALSSKMKHFQSQLPSGVMTTAERRVGGMTTPVPPETENTRDIQGGYRHTAEWSSFVHRECVESHLHTNLLDHSPFQEQVVASHSVNLLIK